MWRDAVTSSDAVAALVAGPDCVRLSGISYDGDPINEIRIRYALRGDTRDYLRLATIGAAESQFAAASQARYRTAAHSGVYSTEIETDVVYDAPTAQRIAQMLIAWNAMRRRVIEYSLDADRWATRVRTGSVVTITDTGIGLTAAVARVAPRTDDQDGIVVRLLLVEDPARDVHAG